MIERCCRHVGRFAAGLNAAGYDILNDVVLNRNSGHSCTTCIAKKYLFFE
jgi:hypothetical protein